MSRFPPQVTRLQTPRGPVDIQSFCPPEMIGPLDFDPSLKRYTAYKPLLSDKETLLAAASKEEQNVTLACTQKGDIVGVALLEYPSKEERWVRVGERIMMEVAVLEVGAAWRSAGIAREMLRALVDHPLKENRIFYMVGYSWTWDLEGTGLTPIRYREMLIGLFSAFGFRTFQTNEPNILLRPENLFMARIGGQIPEGVQKRFKWVRFDMDRYLEDTGWKGA